MKVMLFGANGQLGVDLEKSKPDCELISLTQEDGDIGDAVRMKELFDSHKPHVVINTAAFHKTEECENNPEETFRVNVMAPRVLAKLCRQARARLVQYSSDYVFDGRKRLPYRESDPPRPLSVYGISRLAGEYAVVAESDNNLVIRTASLFGAAGSLGKGGNFVETMVQRAQGGKTTEVVDDVVMSPTYTLDLARMTWTLIGKDVPGGPYHITNSGSASWFELSRKIFGLLNSQTPLKAIRSSDRPSLIQRPTYSALGSERLQELKIQPLRVWQEAVKPYLQEKGHIS